MNTGSTFKDKDQSIYEFYETLQKEYIVCDLRKKIYPREKDKRYYERTLKFKEGKIIDISERNQLPSIFNSESVKKDIVGKIFNEFGLPNFIYRNEAEKQELRNKDIYHYYGEGVEVKVKSEDGIKIGVISMGIDVSWDYVDGSQFKQMVINNDEIVCVKLRGESESLPILTSRVSRIV